MPYAVFCYSLMISITQIIHFLSVCTQQLSRSSYFTLDEGSSGESHSATIEKQLFHLEVGCKMSSRWTMITHRTASIGPTSPWTPLSVLFSMALVGWNNCAKLEWGRRSCESARLPELWPRFDSWTWRHMWAEFVVRSRPSSEGFSPSSPVFHPPQKLTIPNSNSNWKQWTRTSLWNFHC